MKPIFISAGHSNKDPGAAANGLTEARVVTEFRDLVAFYLDQAGVAYTRDGNKGDNLPLSEAVKLIPKGGIAVEFHLNAATPAATGVETLSAPKDFDLGGKLCSAISERLGIKNRGAKPEGSGQHSRLAFVQGGGIIVELFFITNKSDIAAYDGVKWLLAKDVANVLIEAAR